MLNHQTGLVLSLLALAVFAACGAPNEIEALRAPPAGQGVQLYSGAFSIPPSEDAICFATYYDVSASVPSDVRVPCGDRAPGQECFTFRRRGLAQTGAANRSTATVYAPARALDRSDWATWECLGGERDGEPCDPTAAQCGMRSACATPIEASLNCNYFAATADFDFDTNPAEHRSADTVSDAPSILPLKGFVVWSKHRPTSSNTAEQWINVYFSARIPNDTRFMQPYRESAQRRFVNHRL